MMKSLVCSGLVVASVMLGMEKVLAENNSDIRLPNVGTMSCGMAIDGVKADLAKRGYFIEWLGPSGRIQPRVEINGSNIQKYYYNYPANRTDTVTFYLAGDATKLYQGLMSSPMLMATLGSRVMAACDRVGMVEFSHWWEGFVPVGYFPNGTVRAFQWMDFGDENSPHYRLLLLEDGTRRGLYEWGYYYSP